MVVFLKLFMYTPSTKPGEQNFKDILPLYHEISIPFPILPPFVRLQIWQINQGQVVLFSKGLKTVPKGEKTLMLAGTFEIQAQHTPPPPLRQITG